MPKDDGGLGTQLIGDKISINNYSIQVTKLLGEGGFSFVYLVKDLNGDSKSDNSPAMSSVSDNKNGAKEKSPLMVLKVTSIHSRAQRDIAEKEAKLLSRLSHPSIIKMHDSCYRTTPQNVGVVGSIIGGNKDAAAANGLKDGRPHHMILMEYCEGGHALDVCNKLAQAGQRFDLSALIIAFGQICNAVSYLHAQRPPIVHRDLKPVNFLVKNGAYKLCDFGSAVFGHVELKSQRARQEADEVIQKTTTQMFRAPEMVDLYMSNRLTHSTDVWALGGCLYSLAFLQNCFEEGSNLAILSNNYKIPDDNPYGDGLAELIDRMLTVDCRARADMTEVILCLSAIYSGRPLPARKEVPKAKKPEGEAGEEGADDGTRAGTFATHGQGIYKQSKKDKKTTPSAGKKLSSDSAAARRLKGRQEAGRSPGGTNTTFDTWSKDMAFSGMKEFAEVNQDGGSSGFGFEGDAAAPATFDAFGGDGGWGSSKTDSGFPATLSGQGLQESAAAEAAQVNGDMSNVTSQMEAMHMTEEEARGSRSRRSH